MQMFDIRVAENGEVFLTGRFDATQAERARQEMLAVNDSCTVNFEKLEYISSSGLGVLLSVQKRLNESGKSLRLVNLNRHIREVFRIAGFDQIFDIE
jgi:anti-sigma B factor antagonist